MLRPGQPAVADCGVVYRLTTRVGLPCLICALPNGKLLHYANSRMDGADKWGRPRWVYNAYREGQWREVAPYGGQLTENVVSALARELLVHAMFALEDAGYPIVFTVHDEIVVGALGHRQGNHGTDYVGAAAVGRKARRPGQDQGVGRQALSQMNGEQALGRGERDAKGKKAQHTHARSNIVAVLRARRPRARRHRRLRLILGVCRRDRPLAGGRRHDMTSGPVGRSPVAVRV